MKDHSNLILQNHKVDHPPTTKILVKLQQAMGIWSGSIKHKNVTFKESLYHFTTFLVIWYSGCGMTYIWSPSDKSETR